MLQPSLLPNLPDESKVQLGVHLRAHSVDAAEAARGTSGKKTLYLPTESDGAQAPAQALRAWLTTRDRVSNPAVGDVLAVCGDELHLPPASDALAVTGFGNLCFNAYKLFLPDGDATAKAPPKPPTKHWMPRAQKMVAAAMGRAAADPEAFKAARRALDTFLLSIEPARAPLHPGQRRGGLPAGLTRASADLGDTALQVAQSRDAERTERNAAFREFCNAWIKGLREVGFTR